MYFRRHRRKYAHLFFFLPLFLTKKIMRIKRAKSNRGSEIAISNGYIYNKDKIDGLMARWRFQNRTCKGMIKKDEKDKVIDERIHDYHCLEWWKIMKKDLCEHVDRNITRPEVSADRIVAEFTSKLKRGSIKEFHQRNI